MTFFNVIIFTRCATKHKTDWTSQKWLSWPNSLGPPTWKLVHVETAARLQQPGQANAGHVLKMSDGVWRGEGHLCELQLKSQTTGASLPQEPNRASVL